MAFAKQGNYVGLAIMCKRFVLLVNRVCSNEKERVCKSGSSPKDYIDRKLICEIFIRMRTFICTLGRIWTTSDIWKLKDNLKTKLTDKKLVKNVTEYSNQSAFSFLSSVDQILDDINNVVPKNEEPDVGGSRAKVLADRDVVTALTSLTL